MLYSPLLDLAIGRGRLLVCALDVSNRYGIDPVATRVVNRLLQTVVQAETPSATGELAVWGNDYWPGVMKELGRPCDISEFSGLVFSDFFFREVLSIPVLTALPEGAGRDPDGLAGVVPFGKGRVIFCQLYPDYFYCPWQKTKVLRIFSSLLTRCKVASEPFDIAINAEKMDALWYVMPALDFNPDQHRSW